MVVLIKITSILLAANIFFCVAVHGKAPKKIVSGQTVGQGEIPHQISLRVGGQHICGGSIIDSYHILTAAHCVVDEFLNPIGATQVLSRTIDQIYGSYGVLHNIKEIIRHKDFNFKNYENDIAILVLEKPIQLDDYQRPIELSGGSFDKVLKSGTHVVASGWGSDKYWGNDKYSPSTQYLKKLDTKIISNKECFARDYLASSPSLICTHNMPEYNICKGDSGGPLVYKNVLIGIAARSFCDGISPDIFTRVSSFIPWIEEVVQQFPK